MKLIPIKAECHSGYKADEYPQCFYCDNQRFEIEEISDRWHQGDRDSVSPVVDYFKVKAICGSQYIIKYEIESDEWYLVDTIS